MFYFSLLIALFSTLAYFNILIIDVCNMKTYGALQDPNITKHFQKMSLYRWVLILIMSIFWPLSIITF